ncbi:MAG: hypothetical protein JRD89_00555 [Deltaproteobacteria bacterium]|nr:hypothetical protein [Deltaproteobacteria bacterium]
MQQPSFEEEASVGEVEKAEEAEEKETLGAEPEEETPIEGVEEEVLEEEEEKEKPQVGYCREHGEVESLDGRCPICRRFLAKKPYEEAEEKPAPPLPPEVETIKDAIGFLDDRLDGVYGISSAIKGMIIRSLEDDPSPLRDANLLHAYVKSLAPKAYDNQLSVYVIRPLYVKFPGLAQAVDRYLGGVSQVTIYPPPPSYSGYQPYSATGQGSQVYGYTPYMPYPYGQYGQPPSYPYGSYGSYGLPAKPRKVYKKVIDGQEIVTDEEGFRAWLQYERDREKHEMAKREHELKMKKLEAEITKMMKEATSKKEEGDETSKKIDELREELHKKDLEIIKKELEDLKNRPGPLETIDFVERVAERMGYGKTGRTTVDVVDSLAERLDQRAAQLLNKIPMPGESFKPEVTRTPEERAKVAEQIKKKLEKSEEVLEAEEELIRAASKVR